MAGMSSYFKAVLAVMFLCLTASTRAANNCGNPDKLPKTCQCMKNPNEQNQASLECSQLTTRSLQFAFEGLNSNGDVFYELVIKDSDLSETNGLPESWQDNLKNLKFSGITGMTPEDISTLISPLENLKELVLINCNLRHVHKKFFGEKPNLLFMDLDENQIEDIEDGAFDKVPKLEVLSLDKNRLTKTPPSVLAVPGLTTLELSGNKISGFSPLEVEKIRQKDANSFKLEIDTLDCSCEAKDSPIVKWVQERRMQSVTCSYPEELYGSKLTSLADEHFCNSASIITASIWLLLTICLLLL